MDDRGYIAQALFERLDAEGFTFRVLGDVRSYPESAPAEVHIAMARAAFGDVPRVAARFSQEFDLQLVHLARPESDAWRFVFAWSDDVGRPRFLNTCMLRDEDLLLGREAAKRRFHPRAIGARIATLARNLVQPPDAAVAFTGREGGLRSSIMIHVARDLAPLGLNLFEERPGVRRRADFRIVFDVPGVLASAREDVAVVRGGRPLTELVAETERAILRWLECRVERRFPDAVVGPNPLAARVLQFFSRRRIPGLTGLVSSLLNSSISCPVRAPILMPYPYGIVIEAGAKIGSRVTIMQQASLHGAPVIEDNVCIGPGARIAGEVRIGRGATVGANAVVTRDVPSHCTVVGANRILGVEPPSVAGQRLADHESVVNT
jgi:serine acetyltransferase